jgi:hypothetical protein
MADTKYLKCLCAQCGGHIEFPAEGIGMTAPCPHCGWQTELRLEAPTTAPASSSRSLKWLIAGVVILVIGLIGAVSAVLVAQKLAKKSRVQSEVARSGVRPMKTNANPGSPVPSRTKRAEIINDFSASEVKIEKAAGSSLVYASGTVRNETDKQRFGVTVEVDLFDSAEKKIGTAKDYKDTIEPRGQWTFRALLVRKDVTAARIASIREQL